MVCLGGECPVGEASWRSVFVGVSFGSQPDQTALAVDWRESDDRVAVELYVQDVHGATRKLAIQPAVGVNWGDVTTEALIDVAGF